MHVSGCSPLSFCCLRVADVVAVMYHVVLRFLCDVVLYCVVLYCTMLWMTAGMIMASKVWDDLSMWNVDFSQISESFDLQVKKLY